MIINNKKLYNNRCKSCAYRNSQECNKPGWVIPRGNICISYLHKSCTNLVKKSENKEHLSRSSSWSDVIQEGIGNKEIFEEKNIELSNPVTDKEEYLNFKTFNSTIFFAINKKSIEFYSIMPKFLYQCSCGHYYFKPYCPTCCNNNLDSIEVDIDYLEDLIKFFLEDLGLLSVEKILKRIRYLEIEDINIHEG